MFVGASLSEYCFFYAREVEDRFECFFFLLG